MRERSLGINGSSSARPCLNEGHNNGSRVSSFSRQLSKICSRYAIKSFRGLFVVGRTPGHMGASRPSASGSRSRTQPFGPPGRKVDESSTLPDQFTPLKQIGNLPDGACPARPGRRPVSARRRNVARTCDGGAQAPVGPRSAFPHGLRRAARPAHARGWHQWGRLPFSPDWGESFQGRGDTEGSAQ